MFVKLSEEHPWLSTSRSKRNAGKETLFTIRTQSGEVEWRPNRPLLIVSSSSWTEDEDMTPLLQAIERCDARAKKDPNFPQLVFVITGQCALFMERMDR